MAQGYPAPENSEVEVPTHVRQLVTSGNVCGLFTEVSGVELGKIAGNTISIPTVGCVLAVVLASIRSWNRADTCSAEYYNDTVLYLAQQTLCM
jgi:hypothetical protein